MIIMLFGTSNVGKTVVGKKLATRLAYDFYDLDEVIKKKHNTTLEKFMKDNPFTYERHKLKGEILKDLVKRISTNAVIAVCPIYYARFINPIIAFEKVMPIELQDSAEHIFQRLVFSDENDRVYKDDLYKEEHRDYYMKDIREDITCLKKVFKKIEIKYFINNKTIDEVVEGLITIIKCL